MSLTLVRRGGGLGFRGGPSRGQGGVVLGVVAAYQDLKAIGGSEPQEICRLLALIPLLDVYKRQIFSAAASIS